jgi:hypothetical protein
VGRLPQAQLPPVQDEGPVHGLPQALRAGAGGIRGLRQLIRRHGKALEADLRREYGVRLRDLYTGSLTWRELASYVLGLSPTSATRTALNGGTTEPTGEQVLLADLFDAVVTLDWHFALANADEKKATPKKPKAYPRWWLAQPSRKSSTERLAKLDDARRRKQERQQAIAEGRIA